MTSQPIDVQLDTTPEPRADPFVVRIVAFGLALVALAAIVGAIILSTGDHSIPDGIWTLGGAAVGALGALLARTSS